MTTCSARPAAARTFRSLVFAFGLSILLLSAGASMLWASAGHAHRPASANAPAAPLAPGNAGTVTGQYDIAGPAGSGRFGTVIMLENGNFVVADPEWDDGGTADVGAVYLYDGLTLELISRLTGSTAGDRVGTFVRKLQNSNFVVISPDWDNGGVVDAGAVTWVNGTTGLNGAVTVANSLHGTQAGDKVGVNIVVVHDTSGHYVVNSPFWDNGAIADAGAATWVDGASGIPFNEAGPGVAVSATNSLVGGTAQDYAGALCTNSISCNGAAYKNQSTVDVNEYQLANNNFLIRSLFWHDPANGGQQVGAVTWMPATGTAGVISRANSLVGNSPDDDFGAATLFLANGNYIVRILSWDLSTTITDVGAVVWGDGGTGASGVVTTTNTLHGSTAGDGISSAGVRVLTNGNYAVVSPSWDNGAVENAGAVTWVDGSNGHPLGEAGPGAVVTVANSLVGSSPNDRVGGVPSLGVGDTNRSAALTNGNYVVSSPLWDNGTIADAGAVTWVDGTTGISGPVATANSLYGTTAGDQVGERIQALVSNGNYVVASPNWDNGAVTDAGAATWGDGATGLTGPVTAANSLYGTTAADQVGLDGVAALINGNYVVFSSLWDNGATSDVGAATWGDGATGTTGPVSTANSLYGTTASDRVGSAGVAPFYQLTNGNYLVGSPDWDNGATADVGAATLMNGATGTTGPVSLANSLVGGSANDRVGANPFGGAPFLALSDGNYLVVSELWNGGRGAVAWGDGTTGTVGVISSANALVGVNVGDLFLISVPDALPNGQYVVKGTGASNQGSVSWSRFTPGLTGPIAEPDTVFGNNAPASQSLQSAGINTYSELYDILAVGRRLDNIVTIMFPAYPVTVTLPGPGSGVVTSADPAPPNSIFWPGAVDCGISCTVNVRTNNVITLTATPNPGSYFAGWSGGGCSGTGDCVLTADAAQTVAANFVDCSADAWPAFDEATLNFAIGCFNGKATPGTYTITLTQGISLTASTPNIDNTTGGVNLLIEGNGFAVDGQDIAGVRPFQIRPNTTVRMNEITVTGGAVPAASGGGIANFGRLTLDYSTVTGNQAQNAGGIFLNNTIAVLTMTHSILSDNTAQFEGGGIFYDASVVNLIDSTISGNRANGGNGGGGVYSSGVLNIVRSTFTGNSASGNGGAIHQGGVPDVLNVTNSTISGNSAGGNGGGIFNASSFVTLDSATVTGNSAGGDGGAYYSFSSGGGNTFINSILANSTGSTDCVRQVGPFTDGGHNLVESQSGCGFVDGVNNTIVGQDPVLGPLADNGGPTWTHALLVGSPAIDAGDTALATDQRGESRPIGSADDIGAYERQFCEQDAWLVSDETELNEAIACYNAKTVAGTYPITVTQNISLTASTTTIANATAGIDLVIEGSGFTVDGQGTAGVRPFDIAADTSVTMNQITVTGGNVIGSEGGGGIRNAGNLTINDSTVAGNTANDDGGGIYNAGGNLVVSGSTIANNTSTTQEGGGIFSIGGTSTITNSTLSGNESALGGGGALFFSGQHVLDSVTIANNQDPFAGSGLRLSGIPTAVTIRNSIIADNTGSPDCDVAFSGLTDDGHNLVENPGNCNFTTTGSITGQDPVLGPLAGNGGPTETHALLSGSPAIDAGDTTLTTDQRGVARPQGAADDIGAFEAEIGTIIIVKVTQPANNTSFDFTDNIVAPNAFTLSDGQQKDFLIVPTGVYTVTEASNTGSFQLRDLVCVDGDPNGQPSTGDVDTRTATIHLDPDETVTCTFTNSNRPLAVTLASFNAAAQADHVLVTWETVSELENSGFNLYRTATAEPPTAADLQAFVPSQGPGSSTGFFYSRQDYAVTPGEAYWYWLEDVDLSGITTMHGPVSVVFVEPTAVTLRGLEAAPQQPGLTWPWLLAALAVVLAAGVVQMRVWRRNHG